MYVKITTTEYIDKFHLINYQFNFISEIFSLSQTSFSKSQCLSEHKPVKICPRWPANYLYQMPLVIYPHQNQPAQVPSGIIGQHIFQAGCMLILMHYQPLCFPKCQELLRCNNRPTMSLNFLTSINDWEISKNVIILDLHIWIFYIEKCDRF